MPRKPNIIPTIQLKIMLPAPLKAKLDLHLWSDLEGRVPLGAHQRLIVDLLNEYFTSRKESPHVPS